MYYKLYFHLQIFAFGAMWATAAAGLYGPAVSSQSIVHHDGYYASPHYESGYYAAAPVIQAPLAYAAPLAYSGHYDGHDEYVSIVIISLSLNLLVNFLCNHYYSDSNEN